MVSAAHQSLPFVCKVVPAPLLDHIARAWVNSHHQSVSWEELDRSVHRVHVR
jgi:hypothetical protein